MNKQPHQQVVRIATDAKATPLSKNQKTFNQLTARVAEQETLLTELTVAIDRGRLKIQAELAPLYTQFDQLRAELVRLFDRMNTRHDYTRAEQKKLRNLITDITTELIQKGYDDLVEIHDRYNEDGYEAAVAESDEQRALSLKRMAELMYGIEFDPSVDVSDPDAVRAYIHEQLQQRTQADQQRQQEAAAREASRPKSEKQQAREAKKQAEVQNTTKAVRALYMDLVKAFHPDREPDEDEKIRKTTIMQRVTEAYEKSDLLGLFRLQLEFERIDQAHLEKLADNQLLYYNRILKQQADELDGKLAQRQEELSNMTGGRVATVGNAKGLDFAINADIKSMKQAVKALKFELSMLTDSAQLRAWLKSYHLDRG
ncbi:hypothetical protein [Fibrella forsythiae]|uniref:Molecular chaperone DnaJ n=1 Tax=Fibrella forsythiae TaxID=2817061 RepID=A0ABS3JGB5_9BACT|nr:hypothetical protein [Fibrella forsythiae]MBO0949047.1 hypothetical protein [Fibrella forsythiae]